MEDVLALYERPYDPTAPVVCLDETLVSLRAEVRPARRARPGHVAKRDTEYRRCGHGQRRWPGGTEAGRHFTCATTNRSAREFARVLRRRCRPTPPSARFIS